MKLLRWIKQLLFGEKEEKETLYGTRYNSIADTSSTQHIALSGYITEMPKWVLDDRQIKYLIGDVDQKENKEP